MKKSAILFASVLFAVHAFAYDFSFTVNKFDANDGNRYNTCASDLSVPLTQDIQADPQNIELSGNYDISATYGSYQVNNFQNNNIPLYPAGLDHVYGFISDESPTDITINNNKYVLERVVFDAYNKDEASWNTDEATWVRLAISDPKNPNDICFISNKLF